MAFYAKTLPDPFVKADGARITDPKEWDTQRQWIRSLAQTYLYGPWPGADHTVHGVTEHFETIRYDDRCDARREILTLTVDDQFSFRAEALLPANADTCPIIVYNASGAFGLRCPCEREVLTAGYGIVSFDREQIVPDPDLTKLCGLPADAGAAQKPALACGSIMGWAWGHTLVANYLRQKGCAGKLIATGHSRGGKAALCAGVFDDRFSVVAPIGSGCGGCGSARFLGTLDGSRQDETRCETIGRITSIFPDWFCEAYQSFGSKQEPFHPLDDAVNHFPLDAHMLRAACAPNAVFNSEGEQDDWCNSFGAQLCFQAAQPVFNFLGVPNRNAFHIRPGGHQFNRHDWLALVEFCNQVFQTGAQPLHDDVNRLPYAIDPVAYAPWMKP